MNLLFWRGEIELGLRELELYEYPVIVEDE